MEEKNITTTGGSAIAPSSVGEAGVMAREGAEVQASVIVAKRFPRNTIQSMERIAIACARPRLAGAALYSYARGGQEITGPSIRLAEAIAQSWGNISFGIRELEQKNGESTVEAFAWDMETNVRETKVFHVRHERVTKKGTFRLEDPRDIYEMVANQGSRRLRACILGIIPGDVVEDAVSYCEQTLAAKAEVTPERIAKMLEAFGAIGVTKRQIEARIQRHIDSMTPGLMINLTKIYNSVKDGFSSVAEWFPPEENATKQAGSAAALADKIKAREQNTTDFPGPAPKKDEAQA